MSREIKNPQELLAAIKRVPSVASLLWQTKGVYDYEVDLDVIVYGRTYNRNQVGPYFRLLEFEEGEELVRQDEWGGNLFYLLVEGEVEEDGVRMYAPEALIGGVSVLAGIKHTDTVTVVSKKILVLEVQRPALRLLRKLPGFSNRLDESYRSHGRDAALNDINLTPELKNQLKVTSEFRIYTKDHILFRTNEPMDRLYMIKSGWIQRSEGETRDFLGGGFVFGAEGVSSNKTWPYTATVMGRTEVLEVSINDLPGKDFASEAAEDLLSALCMQQAGGGSIDPCDYVLAPSFPRQADGGKPSGTQAAILSSQEKLIDTGVIDGTNVLIMDMDLCVRCGNCSLACHKVHGQSRLARRGINLVRLKDSRQPQLQQSLLFPQVCLHCLDPECLTGCPTGAISRSDFGHVDIKAAACIGCGDCATQCPYDAITMVSRDRKPARMAKMAREALSFFIPLDMAVPKPPKPNDQLLAVKCNLCQNTGLNPKGSEKLPAYSCQENCPTGALVRIEEPLTYFKEMQDIKGVLFIDQTHAISRNIHQSDPAKSIIHLIGILLLIISTAVIGFGLQRYGMAEPIIGWLNLEWLTGFAGLAGIILAMLYAGRRTIYKRRAGPLRYWMLTHGYAGALAGSALLVHTGTMTGGALTTGLAISFYLAVLTGLIGIVVYQVAPRLLTRIEGTPLLLEDLINRRRELRDELAALQASMSPAFAQLVKQRILKRLLSSAYLLRQVVSKDSLDQLIDRERNEATAILKQHIHADSAQAEADGEKATAAIEAAVTLRRADALICLHQSLKIWVRPHIITASLTLALLALHIVQVFRYQAP
jgi:Fe-S-cluster-containing dehydrogenase component/CRP-like cAMP-binding protein